MMGINWGTAVEFVGSTTTDIEFWRSGGLLASALGQTVFALLYLTFPWWKTFLGKALFFKAASFAVVMNVLLLGRTIDWPHEDATFVALYWVLAFGIWVQAFAFLRTRRRGARARASIGNEPTDQNGAHL